MSYKKGRVSSSSLGYSASSFHWELGKTALGLASEKLGSSLSPLESVVINRAFDNYSVHQSSVFEVHVIILFSCINFSVVERWMFTEKIRRPERGELHAVKNSFHFKYF